MASQAPSFIAKSIADDKIVTFRLVSRELSIHVNEAKNQLAAYHAKNKGSGNSAYATFLVSGEVATAPPPDSQESSSMDTSEPTEPAPSLVERRIILSGEEELEAVKSQFVKLFSVHVYSLAANRIKVRENNRLLSTQVLTAKQDPELLAASGANVRDIDGRRGVEQAKKVGMMVAPDVKWTPNVGKPSLQPKAPPPKPKTATVDSLQKPTKSEPTEKKFGTLDWSKAKPKMESSEPAVSIKKDPSPAPPPKKVAAKDFFKAKQSTTPQVKPEQPKLAPTAAKRAETVKIEDPKPKTGPLPVTENPPTKLTSSAVAAVKSSGTTAKPASKQSTARPASKQAPAVNAMGTSSAASGSKRATPSIDSDMEGSDKPERNVKPRLASTASTSKARLQKGRVLSDDDEDEEEEPSAKTKKSSKRKSEAFTEDDSDMEEAGGGKRSRLQKGENAAENARKAKETREKELRKLVEDEDGDTEMHDTTMEADEEAEDSTPEHVPLTKRYKGMPRKEKQEKEVPTGLDAPKAKKKKSKAPLGSNGKPKRKVTKSRVIKMPNGFMKTEDYSSYESASDDEPMIKTEDGESAPKPAVVKKAPPKAKPR
ncbi:hypothetical protein FRB90_001119, partial [Tulasnella sp. 427]